MGNNVLVGVWVVEVVSVCYQNISWTTGQDWMKLSQFAVTGPRKGRETGGLKWLELMRWENAAVTEETVNRCKWAWRADGGKYWGNGLLAQGTHWTIKKYRKQHKVKSSENTRNQHRNHKTKQTWWKQVGKPNTINPIHFTVAAPKLWNILPDHLKTAETVQTFKSFFFFSWALDPCGLRTSQSCLFLLCVVVY